ncbi:hypothetical protein A6R68_02368 [Neotoma lepida]|uniref:Uncharacterized protein n=1 Tax=Neotoma lepida TaxID=56216 RepID=A0A1A6GSD1_NEOLE|nr:hypothetical protein A6R68_02368 [Neotoma lepida]
MFVLHNTVMIFPEVSSELISEESAIMDSIPQKHSGGHINAALAGGASTGARGSKSHLAIASVGKMSPKSMKVALAGGASKSLESISTTVTSLSRKENMTTAIARVEPTSKTDPVTLAPLNLLSERHTTGQTGQQKASEANTKVDKERERKERRAKDRAGSRSSHHHRTGEGRQKTAGDKVVRKSSSHRLALDEKKEKGTPRGTKHNRSHKEVSHIPIKKESWSSHKSDRTLSTTSSTTTSKRPGKIGLFLRNIRANLVAKGLGSQRGQGVDIVAKTLETTNVETIMETGSIQGLDIIGSVTSEVMESYRELQRRNCGSSCGQSLGQLPTLQWASPRVLQVLQWARPQGYRPCCSGPVLRATARAAVGPSSGLLPMLRWASPPGCCPWCSGPVLRAAAHIEVGPSSGLLPMLRLGFAVNLPQGLPVTPFMDERPEA